MKRIVLATSLAAICMAAAAQTSDTPPAKKVEIAKHNCGMAPDFPGAAGMQAEMKRRGFERDLKTYKDCMIAYIEERKATATASMDAANAAINDYNAAMKRLNEEQERPR